MKERGKNLKGGAKKYRGESGVWEENRGPGCSA